VSNDRPVIGNAGRSGHNIPSGNPATSHISAFYPNGGGPQQGFYPGLEPVQMVAERPQLPAVQAVQAEVLPAAAPKSGGLFGGLLNMNQIKTFVDRMGGIEGIISTVSKVQGIMNQFNQVAPMFKMLFSGLGGSKAATTSETSSAVTKKRRKNTKKTGKKPVPKKGRKR